MALVAFASLQRSALGVFSKSARSSSVSIRRSAISAVKSSRKTSKSPFAPFCFLKASMISAVGASSGSWT